MDFSCILDGHTTYSCLLRAVLLSVLFYFQIGMETNYISYFYFFLISYFILERKLEFLLFAFLFGRTGHMHAFALWRYGKDFSMAIEPSVFDFMRFQPAHSIDNQGAKLLYGDIIYLLLDEQ